MKKQINHINLESGMAFQINPNIRNNKVSFRKTNSKFPVMYYSNGAFMSICWFHESVNELTGKWIWTAGAGAGLWPRWAYNENDELN